MGRKKSYITVTDQFCGAGGSSQGVRRYAERMNLTSGLEVSLAMNHWQKAIDTHAANFPLTDHVSTDISACNPRDYVSTDMLITSPECTNHSNAKGKKQVKAQLDAFAKGKADPSAERSRATMWDVVRFAEYHKYRIIITENVVEAAQWILIDAWLKAMHTLGYLHQKVYLNAMFCWPTPQRRDRVFFVFHRKGSKKPNLDIRPLAPCPKCGPVLSIQRFKPGFNVKAKYGSQYLYVCPTCAKEVMPFYFAAINAIDWTIPAVRIGDRKEPLEPKTMQRIAHGMKKYANRPLIFTDAFTSGVDPRVKDSTQAPWFPMHSFSHRAGIAHPPFLVGTEYDDDRRVKGMDEPFPAQTTRRTAGLALPFTMDLSFSKAKGDYVWAGDEPFNTQTKAQSKGVVIPPALMTPFMLKMRGTNEGQVKGSAFGLDEPIGTISAGGKHHALITGKAAAYLVSHYRTNKGSSITDAMPAVTCMDRHGLVQLPELELPAVEDLCFRMVTDVEVGRAQAFPDDYIVHGNKRERVKQFGNANPHPVPQWIVDRLIDSMS